MSTQTKINDTKYSFSSSTIDYDSDVRRAKSKVFFPHLISEYNINTENTGRRSASKITTSDEECFKKLQNIRINISNLRQKVSSYSKIYDNISTQIESGMTNLPKEEELLIENKKLKEENLFYQNENLILKNKINELQNNNESIISKYKDKYIKEIKELKKIFEETLNERNNEINKLKKNQELLLKKIEKIKETFVKEKEELKKYNEEIVNTNIELQRQIGNLYYNKWNNKISHLKKNFIHHSYRNKGSRRKSTENLETVIEEDKTDILLSKNDMKKSYSSLDIKKDDNDVNGKMKKDY